MNSQDKPIDGNDNLDESQSNSNSTEQEKNVVDLWTNSDEDTEIVTEFISAETAVQNDKEAIAEVIAADDRAKSSNDIDDVLDLDNWDFRNVDSSELESESDPVSVDEAEIEVDEIVLEPEIESKIEEISQDDSSEFAQAEIEADDSFVGLETASSELDLEVDPEPISAASLEEIDEQILISDNFDMLIDSQEP
ncbi:MAG: hypothetical protein AAFO95_03930, partial [Cyanobacteria bacterium J06600_6]